MLLSSPCLCKDCVKGRMQYAQKSTLTNNTYCLEFPSWEKLHQINGSIRKVNFVKWNVRIWYVGIFFSCLQWWFALDFVQVFALISLEFRKFLKECNITTITYFSANNTFLKNKINVVQSSSFYLSFFASQSISRTRVFVLGYQPRRDDSDTSFLKDLVNCFCR